MTVDSPPSPDSSPSPHSSPSPDSPASPGSAASPLLPFRHSFGSGPALVLAHGAGGSVRDNFTPLAKELPGRTLAGSDYPGSGDRPPVENALRLEDLADELVAEAVAAGHERFPVLGLSLGSAVALTAAARHPERVSGLVLTVGFAAADPQLRLFNEWYAALVRAGATRDLARLMTFAQSPGVLAATDPEAMVEALTELLEDRAAAQAPQLALAARVDVRHLLPEVSVPVLVVAAGQDRIVLPDSTRALDAVPGAELVELPDAGHIFTPSETAVWAEHISGFLARHGL